MRVKRRLQIQVDEVRNGAELRRSMGRAADEWKRGKRARIKELTAAANLREWNPLKDELSTMTNILRQIEHHHEDSVLPWVAVWQLASGHAHGKVWAQAASHVLAEVPDTRTETGALFRVTIRYGMLAALLLEAIKMIEAAGTKYVLLSQSATWRVTCKDEPMAQHDEFRFEDRPCLGDCSKETSHKIFISVITQDGRVIVRKETNAQCTVCRHMVEL